MKHERERERDGEWQKVNSAKGESSRKFVTFEGENVVEIKATNNEFKLLLPYA